jgi:hypothetical protein
MHRQLTTFSSQGHRKFCLMFGANTTQKAAYLHAVSIETLDSD